MLSLLAMVLAYLLGSISSACIIGRLIGRVDIAAVGDGHISAAAVYRKVGTLPFFIVVIMDMSLAALTVITARLITNAPNVDLLAGFIVVLGHNWSVFLKFKGGYGATAIGGVLICVIFWPFMYGFVAAGAFWIVTHRPGLSTAVGLVTMSVILLIQGSPVVLALYPIILSVPMILKRVQVARTARTAG